MTTRRQPTVGRSIVVLLAVCSIANVGRSVPLIDAVKESDTERARCYSNLRSISMPLKLMG